MISEYEKQYISGLTKIYEKGFSDGINERTHYSTKRLPGIIFQVDVEKEFPILRSKQVFGKTADREMDWIAIQQSNNIRDLKASIWDEWADTDGSIGKSYGYQMAKPVDIYTDPIHKTPESFRHYNNQIEFIIEYLREFPNGRWGNITLWNVAELKDMNLVPCCHTSTWNLDGGRLNCVLDQRSGDMPYGVPFNTTQYAALMCKIAKDLGVKPGILTHVIADAHIYSNQMCGVKEQLSYFRIMNNFENNDYCPLDCEEYNKLSGENLTFDEFKTKFEEIIQCNPKFYIPEDITSFWNMRADVCKIIDYKYTKRIDFGDVAV